MRSAHMMDHMQIMRDEQVGKSQLLLQFLKGVDDLRLDGNIQGGDRLVADDELGVDRQGARDADALALPAGKLMRVAAGSARS